MSYNAGRGNTFILLLGARYGVTQKSPTSMSRSQVSLGNLLVFSWSMILLNVYFMEPFPNKEQEKNMS